MIQSQLALESVEAYGVTSDLRMSSFALCPRERESSLQIPVSQWTRVQQAVVSAALVRCRHVSASEIVFNKPKRIQFFESANNSLIVKVIHTSITCIS
jgi:hypothetical protein